MICPQCTNEVPVTEAQYLSMYTCGKCQAVYFIDITGQPEFGDMSVPIPVEENISTENPISNEFPAPEQNFSDSENNFQSDISNDFASEVSAEISHEISGTDFSMDLNSDVNSFEALTQNEPTSAFGSIANEIADFGNQDNSVSAVSYDLKITGLDTKETMLLFKEAVEDSKFGWMAQDIFQTIKNGECEFKNLNPIQAYVLANRIQFLDIEMLWKQNVQI